MYWIIRKCKKFLNICLHKNREKPFKSVELSFLSDPGLEISKQFFFYLTLYPSSYICVNSGSSFGEVELCITALYLKFWTLLYSSSKWLNISKFKLFSLNGKSQAKTCTETFFYIKNDMIWWRTLTLHKINRCKLQKVQQILILNYSWSL